MNSALPQLVSSQNTSAGKGYSWITAYSLVQGNSNWRSYENLPGFIRANSETDAWAEVRRASIEIFLNNPLKLVLTILENSIHFLRGNFVQPQTLMPVFLILLTSSIFLSFLNFVKRVAWPAAGIIASKLAIHILH
jgi:hypothetical protein